MPKVLDITGQRYGRLVALHFQEHRYTISGVPKRYWKCKCDCGNECVVDIASLRSGSSKSCGCLKIESDKTKHNHITHGQSKTRLYKIWIDMKRRCNDEWRRAYKYYGGKGITYCPEWEHFESFYEWSMSNGYNENLSIDRIDSNGNYEPSNCRWVDSFVQANNTTRNHKITFNGKTQTLSEWAKEYNISYYLLQDRINDLHWSIEDALTIPPSTVNKSHKLLTFNGKTQNITQWAKELGVSHRTITDRIKRGLPMDQVLTSGRIKTKGNNNEV